MRICSPSYLSTNNNILPKKEAVFENDFETPLKHCAEVYFTPNGLLLFQCVLCECAYVTDVKELCEHLTNQHQNNQHQNNTFINNFEHKQSATIDDLEIILKQEVDESIHNEENLPAPNNLIEEYKSIIVDDNEVDDDMLSIEYTICATDEPPESLQNGTDVDSDKTNEECSEDVPIEVDTNDSLNIIPARRAGPRVKDNDTDRRFKCNLCGLAFKEAYNLRQHIQRHTKAERFKCSQCNKRFHTRTELNTHERRHTGEMPYMCEECGRRFITSGGLCQHMRRHSNVRPYECDHCNKRFFDASQLKHHYIVHTRERQHTCLTCNAKFARRKSLVTHMKIHANKREYVCNICQAAFNQAPGLRMHLRNKHKDIITVQEMLNKEKNTI